MKIIIQNLELTFKNKEKDELKDFTEMHLESWRNLMNNYQLLQRNSRFEVNSNESKIDEYITKINEDKISIVDAILTNIQRN